MDASRLGPAGESSLPLAQSLRCDASPPPADRVRLAAESRIGQLAQQTVAMRDRVHVALDAVPGEVLRVFRATAKDRNLKATGQHTEVFEIGVRLFHVELTN